MIVGAIDISGMQSPGGGAVPYLEAKHQTGMKLQYHLDISHEIFLFVTHDLLFQSFYAKDLLFCLLNNYIFTSLPMGKIVLHKRNTHFHLFHYRKK